MIIIINRFGEAKHPSNLNTMNALGLAKSAVLSKLFGHFEFIRNGRVARPVEPFGTSCNTRTVGHFGMFRNAQLVEHFDWPSNSNSLAVRPSDSFRPVGRLSCSRAAGRLPSLLTTFTIYQKVTLLLK